MKQNTWMWITFLFGGIFIIYIGYILNNFLFFITGLFFIVGSVISLYYLYASDDKRGNNERK